ncbi:hypothetical protein [Qipengyuania flava]|uniref:hypothetical protein n=1 Tax=Qipengyuania flava TaxID=192812 RepID=UPI001C636264|nr:hypothetical protein [Qipengyuania flava]QYJ06072.1 hypothetical protein KUV82_08175 [Qipengyuania flava]
MTDVRVAFPEPCGEQWDQMAPRGCNRHCAACDTEIHDLAALTADEIEALANSGEKVCVRAHVAEDGTVATRSASSSGKRRVVAAAVGASLSLAACQTAGEPRVTPLYTVSGSFGWGTGDRTVTLTRWDGQSETKRVQPRREFHFGNLHEGSYVLRLESGCADPIVQEIEVGPAHINVGEVNFDSECIIVGVMQPAARSWRG